MTLGEFVHELKYMYMYECQFLQTQRAYIVIILGGGCVLDAQTQNGDEPVGEYSFSGQSCLSSADSC